MFAVRCLPVVRPVASGPRPTVAVVSSASPAFDASLVQAGLAALEDAGLRVVMGRAVGRERGYLAGTPEERAADLHWAFGDPDVDVVLQIRGGYGCGQVVPLLDFELIAAHPKPFVGMSDITLLHLALGRHAGLVTFWGPNCVQLGRDGSGYSVDRLSRALRGEIPPVGRPDGAPPLETLVPGRARGPLAGGTTTLLAASLGTTYELETEGRVLLLEDVHVEPYQVDRCLTQLLHAGKLDAAAGFAIAEHSDVRTKESFGGHTLELAEVFDDILAPLGRPTVYGLPLGHSPRIATVPLGVEVELDAGAGILTVQD
jgi:muramoyltetrapeptide carboxypeptidase